MTFDREVRWPPYAALLSRIFLTLRAISRAERGLVMKFMPAAAV